MSISQVLKTRMILIGGTGEFGANATVFESPETAILVDFGLMFPPDQSQPGVDFYVKNPTQLLERFPKLSAIFITHGHEDHIGGLGFLLSLRKLPIYALPYTAYLIEENLKYFKGIEPDLRNVTLNEPVQHEDFSVEFLGVTHSIAQASALAIQSGGHTIIHSGDFKVDPLPEDDHPFQSERFRQLGEAGVDLLVLDSTNAARNGFCPSEYEIMGHVELQVRRAKGRVFLTTFSSQMPRLKKLKKVAKRTGRKIALLGRSFQRHYTISLKTDYLSSWSEIIVSEKEAKRLSDDQVIYVLTGSQGEARAAIRRVLGAGLRSIKFKAGDTVIFSSKAIPGNERHIALLTSELRERGLEVITDRDEMVHASGHGYREELAYLYHLLRPRFVVPVHGEFNQLLSHHGWLRNLASDDQEVLLLKDFDQLELAEGKASLLGQIEAVDFLPIDGALNVPLPWRTLSERKDMMYTGQVLVSAAVQLHNPKGIYEVAIQGMVERREGHLKAELLRALDHLALELTMRENDWAESMKGVIRKQLRKMGYGRPVINVVINGKIR